MKIEDAFLYMEPPRVYQPVRQCLGYVLLESGHPKEAEQVSILGVRPAAVPSQVCCHRQHSAQPCTAKTMEVFCMLGPSDNEEVEACKFDCCVYTGTRVPTVRVIHCLLLCRCTARIWSSTRTMAGPCMASLPPCMPRESTQE